MLELDRLIFYCLEFKYEQFKMGIKSRQLCLPHNQELEQNKCGETGNTSLKILLDWDLRDLVFLQHKIQFIKFVIIQLLTSESSAAVKQIQLILAFRTFE